MKRDSIHAYIYTLVYPSMNNILNLPSIELHQIHHNLKHHLTDYPN
jgi:hypothetical protein